MAGATGRQLRRCVEEVTVEEFRIGDFRVERDAAFGRQLLFLLTNEEWLRRTSEQLELKRVRVVDTEVVVDVDLAFVTPAALDGRRPLWLPILAVPPAAHGAVADPVTSLEVTDASGARVFKLPQSEVHRRFAAAVAELVLARLPGGRAEADGRAPRDELVLLAAGVRRLLAAGLAGSAPLDDDGGPDDADPGLLDPGVATEAGERPPRIDTGRARAEERLEQARSALVTALDADAARTAPLVASRLLEMLDALVGVVFVVVPADPAAGPTSFAVRLPGRRLRQDRRRGGWRRGPGCRWRCSPRRRTPTGSSGSPCPTGSSRWARRCPTTITRRPGSRSRRPGPSSSWGRWSSRCCSRARHRARGCSGGSRASPSTRSRPSSSS